MQRQRYISQGGASPGQLGGNLWLSEVFGAELIIPSYNTVVVQLSGNDDQGNPCAKSGTGLILDDAHVVTNKHVVAPLIAAQYDLPIYSSSNCADVGGISCECVAHLHPDLDVGVIEVHLPAGKQLPQLAGMAFRDPTWADEVYVFGYPRVPMTTETVITVQRGEVVNPAAETPATADHPREKIFLYSAIARPGNGGIAKFDGPVLAQ